jgi:FtsP/CotA-like multicopper oxidase with cupredoxin domain
MGSRSVSGESLQPAGWDSGLRLAEAPDINPDPRILEIALDARVASVEIGEGLRVDAWTYNGGLPGPLIRARVGDRLIVHFTNHLPQPTTVHWHGLRVPVAMDGVPDVSQPQVKPGESFTYDLTLRDAGLYWYHPHVMSAAQVGFGLYGALLVDDPADAIGVSDELVLVLSDIALEADGRFEDPESGGSAGMAFGREGNHLLVNGRKRPVITATSGAPQRWRIVNAAKSRYFDIDIEGTRFTVIGGDGGLQQSPVKTDRLVLAPGERIDAIMAPQGPSGREIPVNSLLFNRGYGSVEARQPIEELFAITISNAPAYTGQQPKLAGRAMEPLDLSSATQVKIEFGIAQLRNGDFEYHVNGVPFAKDQHIGASLGETQVWTIVNTTPWSHPFHLHGFFFQVLDESGQPVRPLAWKDTVNVPFKETVRVAVRFDDDRPGMWMFHCHVLDHADGGLMGMVHVSAPPAR